MNQINKQFQNLSIINNRINKEICYATIDKMKDINLLSKYIKTKSVKKSILTFETILTKYEIDTITQQSIINDTIHFLIPPGTKSVIRGNLFNEIIKNKISNLNLDNNKFTILFEKKCQDNITNEIPDWIIKDNITKKTLIGMNQLDIWSGGHQLNRGYSYIINNNVNTHNCKFLCVICNYKIFKNTNSKSFKLFQTGFDNNTLCYINNLECIIKTYFELK